MSKIENKARYYFGDKPVIEKASDEDEFEGTFTETVDLELLAAIEQLNLPNFWHEILIELATLRCAIEISDDADVITLKEVSPIARTKYPHGYTQQQMWSEGVVSARKKGWNWSGDTDVCVKKLNGPKNLAEAVISLMISESHSYCWLDISQMQEPSQESAYNNWRTFWDDSVRTNEHDLPSWSGKPERDLVLKSDGNTKISLVQKLPTTFIVVYYFTS